MKKTVATIICVFAAGIVAHTQSKESKPPPPPPPKPSHNEAMKLPSPTPAKPDRLQGFYERNDSVLELSWETRQQLIVIKKDSSVERYNLTNEGEKKSFIEKYGFIPAQPPPPPPPKPEYRPVQ